MKKLFFKKFNNIILKIKYKNNSSRISSRVHGFTLMEILLSVALITIIAGVSVPIYFSLFSKNDLDVAKNQVAQSLGRASFLSQGLVGDSTWGVKVLPGNIVIFKGLNYSGRDTNYDEVYQMSSSVTHSGLSEVVFYKMTGFPQTTGDIILTSTNGENKTITINSKGSINY